MINSILLAEAFPTTSEDVITLAVEDEQATLEEAESEAFYDTLISTQVLPDNARGRAIKLMREACMGVVEKEDKKEENKSEILGL